jgi:hypothetical protein
MIFKRYLERKSMVTLKLALMMLFLATALILDPIFLGVRAATTIDYISLQGVLSFGLSAIANIFLVLFLVEVFFKGKLGWTAIILMVISATVLPIGIYMYNTGQDTLPLLLVHLLVTFIILLTQAIKGLTLRRRMMLEGDAEKLSINGFLFISLGGIMQFLTYVSFIMQELGAFLGDLYEQYGLVQNGATIFIPIAFFLSGVASFMLYLGFIMPAWFKKRWEQAK